MSEKIRQHIIFSGRVQGVGFRWHVSNFARLEGLTGWVRNLDDGTVEMEVQGSEIKIGKLIQYMEGRNYVLIENMDFKSIPVEEGEWTFYER